MGSGQERWRRQALIPTSRTPPDTGHSAPIYSSLVDEWRARGMTLPDRYDGEWDEIISRDIWPGSR